MSLPHTLLYARTFHADGAPGLIAINAGEEGEEPVLEVSQGGRGREKEGREGGREREGEGEGERKRR